MDMHTNMKKLLLLLLLPVLAFGQVITPQRFFQFANGSVQQNQTSTIELLNHKRIWRVGVSNTTTIVPPTGYTVSWTVKESETLTTLFSGSTTSISRTMAHADQFAHYDLEIEFTNGVKTYTQYLRRIITVLPQRGTPDETFDLTTTPIGSGGKTWSDIDRAGYKLYYSGSYNDRVQINRLYTDATDAVTGRPDYIHIWFDSDAVITAEVSGRAYALQFIGNCRGIWIDTYNDDDNTAGTTFRSSSLAGSGQTVYVSGSNNKEIVFSGMNIVGVSNSAAALSIQGPTPDATYNYNTFNFSGLNILDCTITNAGDEGIYCNYFTDAESGGYRRIQMNGARIFRNSIINAGWDGIQIGIGKDAEIHNNYIENSGTKNTGGQNYSIIMNPGCSGIVYQNRSISVRPAFFQHVGDTGEPVIWCSNVVESSGADYWLITNIRQHVTASKLLQSRLLHNTIISTGRVWYNDDTAGDTDLEQVNIQNNIIVGDYVLGTFLLEDFTTIEVLTGNEFDNNAADIGFTNSVTKDYTLSESTISTVFEGVVLTEYSWIQNYGIDGVNFADHGLGIAKGAYSGYELTTN